MIQGYPEDSTVVAGTTLRLHVSTAAPKWRVTFYRCGGTVRRMEDLAAGWLSGSYAAPRDADEDWNWPAYEFAIPRHWPAGVYIAMLDTGEGRRSMPPDQRYGRALFVVRDENIGRARVLYKLPLFTYHAYNIADKDYAEQCLYTGCESVTLHRPGGGSGGTPWDIFNVDAYDRSSPRQTFAHWDAPFIAWLENNGYVVDFCTDLDVHLGRSNLARYALLVSAGHDEYWSDEMRSAVERFIANGGNLAFFSGNTSYFRIAANEDSTCIRRAGIWHQRRDELTGASLAENALTGVSYRNGGGRWRGARPPTGYRVQHSRHWIFEGAGVRDGDVFGAPQRLVGYECDGAHFDRELFLRHGLASPSFEDSTPRSFQILGVADLSAWDMVDGSGEVLGNGAATMGLYERGGTVFNAATVDWPRVVTVDREPVTTQITRNVLNRLSNRSDRALDAAFSSVRRIYAPGRSRSGR